MVREGPPGGDSEAGTWELEGAAYGNSERRLGRWNGKHKSVKVKISYMRSGSSKKVIVAGAECTAE